MFNTKKFVRPDILRRHIRSIVEHLDINVPIFTCLLIASIGILPGCSGLSQWRKNNWKLGPDYKKPDIKVPAQYVSLSLEKDTDMVRTDWWKVFNDPILEELIQTAYKQNLSLRAAALRVLQARTDREIDRLNLLPQSQTASGAYSYNLTSQNAASSAPGQRSFDDWQTSFDLSWELDVWGRIRRQIESAEANHELEMDNFDDVLVTLIGDVAANYIDLRSLDERILLAEKNAEIQKGSLEIAQSKFEIGATSELDVQQAISNHADTLATIPTLRQNRRITVNTLATLLGMYPPQLLPKLNKAGKLPDVPEKVVVGIPANLLRRRPDVRAAERTVAAQSAQIGIAQAELYPQFAISSVVSLNAEQFGDLFDNKSAGGVLSPGFSWKILNYGRLKRGVELERLKFKESVVNYENTVLEAYQEVEDAMVQFLEEKRRIVELRRSAAAAEKAVELVRIQYREGDEDFDRVFTLESALVERQDQLALSEASVATSLVQLYKALGGGWQLRMSTLPSGQYAIFEDEKATDRNTRLVTSSPPK